MKKKQVVKELIQQLELLNIEFIKMRERESLQKLMDKKITEILEKQLVAKNQSDRMQEEKEAKDLAKLSDLKDRYDKMQEEKIEGGRNEKEFLKEQLGERKSAEGLWEGPDRPKQMTESENKTQVLAMRQEWETKKEEKISKAKNERIATNERERARWSLYNKGVLESTDKSKEQNKSDNEFEDTSEPEPYIQKEQSKEEEEAELLAVRKQIDSQLKGIRDRRNKYNDSNHNGA